jgi:hypothetical protein
MMPDWTWYPSVPITAVGRAMTQAACDYEQIMCELHVLTGHPASAWHTFIEAEWQAGSAHDWCGFTRLDIARSLKARILCGEQIAPPAPEE